MANALAKCMWMEAISQATVLGALLSLLYINDWSMCISKQSTINLFNADRIMYRNMKTIQDQIDFQKYLDTFMEWADR